MIRVRVGSLKPGDWFRTLVTGKSGTILPRRFVEHDYHASGVDVAFEDRDRTLHPDVLVEKVDALPR